MDRMHVIKIIGLVVWDGFKQCSDRGIGIGSQLNLKEQRWCVSTAVACKRNINGCTTCAPLVYEARLALARDKLHFLVLSNCSKSTGRDKY